MPTRYRLLIPALLVLSGLGLLGDPASSGFRFVLLGDRTGEAQPGVFEQVWRETAEEKPAFVLTVGDTIQGTDDKTAEAQWLAVQKLLAPYKRIPLYLTPGNHDIWSEVSEKLYQKYSGHAPHYSFDYQNAHFTILDNSRSDEMPAAELTFLDKDLQAHTGQSVKFVVSHRPSWLLNAAFGNREFPLHKLVKKYGVQYVIAGHVHEMLHIDLDGVTYLSMPSAGGHLRGAARYEDGWFFAHTLVEVGEKAATMRIKEVKAPKGKGRVTTPADWGRLGLTAAEAPR